MKQLLLFSLVLVATISHAQEFAQPGWFNVTRRIEPGQGGAGAASSQQTALAAGQSAGPLGLQSAPIVAEAVTPEIEALARGLENDPLRIYHYVHDHIRHVLYFGSKKGAQLTLLERSGNDFDQCALLVALLRAAGHSPSYQFGVLKMPLDSANHNDLRHWLQLSVANTNWSTTVDYFSYLLGTRGYPQYAFFPNFGDNNTIGFHRVWVKLNVGGTDYLLDPAFKVSEPLAGIDLHSAMGLDTNALAGAAGGTNTADFVQSLNETSVRNKLRDYTTNLLSWLQNNAPSASVQEVIGGWEIQPATNTALSQTLLFANYNNGGAMPVLDWDNQPTNLMSRLTLSFEGTNYQWMIPALQGQRLSLTFESNGVARLWQDDTLLVQKTTSGLGSTIPVTLAVNHPFGTWDTVNNTLIDTSFTDGSANADYQRTNATYAVLYAFEASPESLRSRQDKLDAYRQQGLTDTSREVVSETLNVMGLGWMEQTELAARLLTLQGNVLNQRYHRFGRMAQEKTKGYYVDAYMQLTGFVPAGGSSPEDLQRRDRAFDLSNYFVSALEHAIIEQLQSTNLVAASTVKMLQLASTNSLKIFLANSANWTTGANVRSQLTNYSLGFLDSYINAGYSLLLPRDGSRAVAGSGSWTGYGLVAWYSNSLSMVMLIGGAYNGGFVSNPNAGVNPSYVSQSGFSQQTYLDLNGAFARSSYAADPVRMSDGAFHLTAADLSVGQAEPRGFTFSRSYNSARRRHNLAGMAHGWTHNYAFKLAEVSAPEAGLGQTTPAQMAPMLVAIRAAYELYSATNNNPKNWLLTALIAKWGVDQIINNAVSVTLGEDTVQFVRQPDGNLTPPANCTMTLVPTNGTYHLLQRHGNTFKFDSNRRLTNIVDQYGQSLRLAYNASNWVTTATDWKNRALTLNYSGTPSRLTSISDGTRSVAFAYGTTYSAQSDLLSVTDPESKTTTFIYDGNHQLTATRNPLTQTVTSNAYDGFGRVIEQYNQGDTNQTWRFYWSGFVNTEQDPAGARRRFIYDGQAREIGQQNALGHTRWTFYDGQNHVIATLSPLDELNQFQFDGRHNLVRSIDPLGYTNTFNYDAQDRLMSTVDARGNTSRLGYNSKFQLTGSTNGAGDWTTFIYHATEGTLTSRADAGGTTTYGYDTWGQLSSVVHPASLGTNGFLNNARGDVLSITNGRKFVTSFQYNARRQLTNSVAPTNLTARMAYDAVGNMQSSTDARGFSTTNFWSATRQPLGAVFPATPQGAPATTNLYDARDWLARTLNPLQQATLITNDAAGRLVSATDPLLRTVRFGYDADGRRLATTNAALEVMKQTWTARSELTKFTDGANNTVLRAYDAAGNQVTLTNRNGKKWQFQFDAANRLTNTITPLNRETRITFDPRGLVSAVREPSAQTTINFYDARGRLTNSADAVASKLFRYDANNSITNLVEAGKTNAWTYDAYDRVTSYKDADGNLMQYRYDQNGNVTNLIYPGGKNVFYAYDRLNRLTNVTDWANRKTSMEYDLASRLKKITRPNGTVRTMDYDAAGEATNIWEKTSAGVPIALFKLHWNAAARVEWEFAAPPPHPSTPPTRTMTFDDDNRLATFNGQSVTHDLDGNLTSGPLTNDSFATYTYDARNRLINVGQSVPPVSLSYGYDALGNRTAITNGATVTKFVINPNAALSQVLMRIKNGVTNYYVYGVGLLYEADAAGNTRTYHYDYRGSTVALTDGSGNVTDRAEYSAYGSLTYRLGATDTPFLYNGRYGVQTDANGLLHMRARYYNPHLCRFLNPDPIGFSGGMNFYAYADGNPVSLLDPFGLGAVGENGSASLLGEPCLVCHGRGSNGRYYGFTSADGVNTFSGLEALPNSGQYARAGYAEIRFFTEFTVDMVSLFAGPVAEISASLRAGTLAAKTTANVAGDVAAAGSRGPSFIAAADGSVFPVPRGATGPLPTRAPGMQFTGGSGGYGLDPRVTGVRFMDANANQGARAVYMNQAGQTVNPFTGRTVPYSDPTAHFYFNPNP